MTIKEFSLKINNLIEEYPTLKVEIMDYYSLALSEIEEGGSPTNEMDVCLRYINELIDQYKNNKNDI